MTTLSNLGQLSTLAHTSFSQSKFWNRDAESITPVELSAYIKRMSYEGKEEEARSHVQAVLDAIRESISAGIIQGANVERMKLSEGVFTVSDLLDALQGESRARRAAIIFALESALTPESITFLTHARALKMRRLTPLARSIVRSRPRHILTPLLFWDALEKRVLPVLRLREEFEKQSGMKWWMLEDSYSRMILVDGQSEYEAFVESLSWVL